MKSKSYTTEGIILAKKDFGEADKIITIFTNKFGKLSLIAKGVKRPSSRKRGHIEVFSHILFQGIPTSGLDQITEVETINSFEKIKKNLTKVTLAYYFLEVINKITHDHEPNVKIFDLLNTFLKNLSKASSLKEYRNRFINEVLVELGFWPEGSKMVNHDKTLEEVIEKRINSYRVGKIITNG